MLGCFATVGSVIYVAYTALLEDFATNLSAQQANETAHISSLVSQDLELRTNALAQFASILSQDDQLLPAAQLTSLLKMQQKLSELFPHSLTVSSANATLIAENTSVPDRVGTNYADRPHWREAMTTRKPVISRPLIVRTSGIPLMVYSALIESDNRELLGFV